MGVSTTTDEAVHRCSPEKLSDFLPPSSLRQPFDVHGVVRSGNFVRVHLLSGVRTRGLGPYSRFGDAVKNGSALVEGGTGLLHSRPCCREVQIEMGSVAGQPCFQARAMLQH